MDYINGVVTTGSYFTYNGVRYGKGTIIRFTDEFYEKTKMGMQESIEKYGHYSGGKLRTFHSVTQIGNQTIWKLHNSKWTMSTPYEYVDIIPDKDIKIIITPVWYYQPKELVKLRLSSGMWIFYIWKQTLFYAVCLLISPIFQEWYLIWTLGLYAYLRLCYIELSRGELNRGW